MKLELSYPIHRIFMYMHKQNGYKDDDDDDDLSASNVKDDQDHFFSIHYKRLLTESDVDDLKDLFSKTLTLNKEVHCRQSVYHTMLLVCTSA